MTNGRFSCSKYTAIALIIKAATIIGVQRGGAEPAAEQQREQHQRDRGEEREEVRRACGQRQGGRDAAA